ncbi:MAG: hypothetical protein JETT_2700 [Candidatus Jettenia ecosi]|uniref:Uncharacterized protein n=1 Tax=Candidatus Jettenia ecosi TaxID=2494326 RepID=A0A533Q8P8_9BACT|nr:MAG: hypothetical protein JETT_2700 [Candidatus Jettenia ecosi]
MTPRVSVCIFGKEEIKEQAFVSSLPGGDQEVYICCSSYSITL